MLKRREIGGYLVAGCVSSLSFSAAFEWDDMFWGGFVAIYLLMVSVTQMPFRLALIYGAACGMVTWLLTLRWIVVDGQNLISCGVLFALSIIGGSHWLLFSGSCCLTRGHWSRFVFLPVLWALLEEARNWVLIGCPWYFLSYPLTSWSAGMQLASCLGASGLSGLIVLLSLCIAEYANAVRNRKLWASTVPLAAAVSLIALTHVVGRFLMQRQLTVGPEIHAAVMQTNFVSERSREWDAIDMCNEWAGLASIAKSSAPDIVLAPESCFPNPLAWAEFSGASTDSVPDVWNIDLALGGLPFNADSCTQTMEEIACLKDEAFLFGAVIQTEWNTELKRNSALLKDRRGDISDVYLKRACLPFFEHQLWGVLLDDSHSVQPSCNKLSLRQFNLRSGAITHYAPLICYEDTLPFMYEEYCREAFLRSTPIVVFVVGNESLCKSSSRAHLQIAQMRAVEFGVPIIRAVNSGNSAFINAFGKVQMDLGQSCLDVSDRGAVGLNRIAPCTPETFYSRHRQHLLWTYVATVIVISIHRLRAITRSKRMQT